MQETTTPMNAPLLRPAIFSSFLLVMVFDDVCEVDVGKGPVVMGPVAPAVFLIEMVVGAVEGAGATMSF
jgi:hypothetical protein